jgi:long-chain-fatty-acid--CoA ligase ACSBG
MGYMHSPEATLEAIDKDGYIHTGDIAQLDSDNDPNISPPSGFVRITGRLKEIIITSGGENMSPLSIEHLMKSEMPAISNCIIVGDQRKFVTMLISLKCEVDPSSNVPTDRLAEQAMLVCSSIGSGAKTMTEASRDPAWHKYIEEGMARANQHAVSHAQRVQKWRMLPIDLSESGGELTATMKIKRKAVYEKYKELADEMYQGGP